MNKTQPRSHYRPAGARTEDEDVSNDAHVVAAHDGSAGGIGFDELGQPRWTWAADGDRSAEATDETFDFLKALDNDTLSLADTSGAAQDRRRASAESGYDPYDTARIDMRGKFGRP